MNLLLLLLIGSTVFNTFVSLIKKIVMNRIGTVQATSLSWWLSFFLNPYIIAVLAITLIIFALNMWIFSLISLNRMMAWVWALNIGAFFLTLFLSRVFLGETFVVNAGFMIIMVSMVTGFIGAYLF